MHHSAIIIGIIYIISYFVPNLFIWYRKLNIQNSEEPIEGFYKLNTIFILLLLLCLLGTVMIFYIFVVSTALVLGEGTFANKINLANRWFTMAIWDNGETSNTWVALVLGIVLSYSIFMTYFLTQPKGIQAKFAFPIKQNDEDEEYNEEDADEWQKEAMFYKLYIAFIISLILFNLALLNMNAISAWSMLYIAAIVAVYLAIEWKWCVIVFYGVLLVISITTKL